MQLFKLAYIVMGLIMAFQYIDFILLCSYLSHSNISVILFQNYVAENLYEEFHSLVEFCYFN